MTSASAVSLLVLLTMVAANSGTRGHHFVTPEAALPFIFVAAAWALLSIALGALKGKRGPRPQGRPDPRTDRKAI